MRIAIGGFHHETNTFSPVNATLDGFTDADGWPGLSVGEELLENLAGCSISITGFMEEAVKNSWELAPLLWCNSPPAGRVNDDAFEYIAGQILDGLESVLGQVDALYLDLHGAMVTGSFEDGEGELLRRIRDMVGNDLPIIVSLDLHANVTEQMVALSDIMVGFKTYPHIDMRETGARAAHILQTMFDHGQKPLKKFSKLSYLISITSQCTLIEPAKSLYGLVGEGDCLTSSFLMGFPPADIKECGPSIVVYAFDKKELEEKYKVIKQFALEHEAEFLSKLWQPKEAVAYAIKNAGDKPIILADTQDNPGAGATSNTTGILRELIKQKATHAVLACFYDPANADKAHKAGKGADLEFTLGGTVHGDEPFTQGFEVEALGAGVFKATGPVYGGNTMQMGQMAVLRHGGVRVVLTSRKTQAADQAIFKHVGINPAKQKILVLKSSVHFRADFDPIAKETIVVESPGLNIESPAKLPYKFLREGVRRD